jgi:protein TonB
VRPGEASGWRGSVAIHVALVAGLVLVAGSPAVRPPVTVDFTIVPPTPSPGVAPDTAEAARPELPRPVAPARPSPPNARPSTVAVPAPTERPAPAAPEPAPTGLVPEGEDAPVAVPAADVARPVFSGPAGPGPPASAGPGAAAPGSGVAGGSEAREVYLARHFDHIREAIQKRITYPPMARRMGWTGRVVLSFRIQPDGEVSEVRVVKGSGHPALDENAADSVRRASPFPRPPFEARIVAPVVYNLD